MTAAQRTFAVIGTRGPPNKPHGLNMFTEYEDVVSFVAFKQRQTIFG